MHATKIGDRDAEREQRTRSVELSPSRAGEYKRGGGRLGYHPSSQSLSSPSATAFQRIARVGEDVVVRLCWHHRAAPVLPRPPGSRPSMAYSIAAPPSRNPPNPSMPVHGGILFLDLGLPAWLVTLTRLAPPSHCPMAPRVPTRISLRLGDAQAGLAPCPFRGAVSRCLVPLTNPKQGHVATGTGAR